MTTIRIPLGPSGKHVGWAMIDLEDYERLIVHRWYLAGRGYAFRTLGGRSVFMHREVLNFPASEDIDHINGDKLDNRRENLRAVTHVVNCRAGVHATVAPLEHQIRELRLDGWTNVAIAERFGISAPSVLRYASDLPRVSRVVWTRERCVEFIQDFHREHGRLPAARDMDGKDGRPSFTTMHRRFDSMPAAREAAGFGAVDLRRAS